MIDWYVLLIPLVLAPIALMFVFVGCALETAGEAGPIVTTTRRVSLKYDNIPNKTNPILKVQAAYSVVPGAMSTWGLLEADLDWDTALESGTVPEVGFAEFQAGENVPVDVTCTVTLVRSDATSITVPPATAEDQKDNFTAFWLTYTEADPAGSDYHNFELAPLD